MPTETEHRTSSELVPREVAVEHPICFLCGCARAKDLLAARDRRYRIPGDFKIVECEDCGMRYVSPRPTAADIGRYYPADYPAHLKKPSSQDAGAVSRFFSKVWDGYQRMFLSSSYPTFFYRRHIERFRRPDGPPRVLDIGCGSGQKLAYLQKFGWDVYGADFSELAIGNARASGITHAEIAPGDALPFPDEHVDAVMSWHSLEHHYDPLATLREALRVLRPGGYAIFAVPASESLGLRAFGSYWGPLEVPRHLHHFTAQTLRRAGEQAGFRVLASFYDFSFYGLFLDQEILDSIENIAAERGVEFRFPRPKGMSILARIPVLPLNGLLGRLWRGGNLIVHFSKP